MIEIAEITSKSRYGIDVGDVCFDKNVFLAPFILITSVTIYENKILEDKYTGIYTNGEGCTGDLKDLKNTGNHIDGIAKILQTLNSMQAAFYDD